MADFEFHIMEPPYFQLEEAIHWIEFTQIPDVDRDYWRSMLKSIDLLENALRTGELRGFASLDASPVQPIASCAWTEFEIHPHLAKGEVIWKKDQGSVAGYLVRSFKAFRAAALKDLSQPANAEVPGQGHPEPGFHRVMDQVIFLEADVRRAFPAGNAPAQSAPPMDKRYPKILQKIEGGRYLYNHEPLTFDEIYDLVIDYLAKQRQLTAHPNSVRKGLERHYREFSGLRH
jgi:hypothetical protein